MGTIFRLITNLLLLQVGLFVLAFPFLMYWGYTDHLDQKAQGGSVAVQKKMIKVTSKMAHIKLSQNEK